jgi:hypothetical protein
MNSESGKKRKQHDISKPIIFLFMTIIHMKKNCEEKEERE